jgi:hypothetical protein
MIIIITIPLTHINIWLILHSSGDELECYNSFERFYWSDPFFHADETDPLANLPHGYLLMDDVLFVFRIATFAIKQF